MGTNKLCFLFFGFLIPALQGVGVPGGPKEIPLDDPRIPRLTELAVSGINGNGANKELVEVKKVTTQVVSGTLTKLILSVKEGNTEEICKVSIWEQPWLNKTEVTKVQCDEVQTKKKAKRSIVKDSSTLLNDFNDFMIKHNKVYADKREYKKRFLIYKANLKKIELLRESEQGTAEYGVNWFADLSQKEFKQYLGLKKPNNHVKLPKAVIPNINLPNEFDWRHYNVVTPVKNQQACGSCWAFSVTGNIEGQWALKKGELLSLSEQELVDCDTADDGCSGGYMTQAYESIVKLGGLETEKDYPYDAEDEQCKLDRSEVKVVIQGGVNITSNETDMAKWLVKNGPMSVAVNANAMQFYMGGVSHPFKFLCNPEDLDHGVLVVGYGVHQSKILKKTLPYWIIKNSWGTRWGELGYYKLYRGDGSCGINQMVSSAVVN